MSAHQCPAQRPSIPETTERVAAVVVASALAVHSALGPGLLESAYERALTLELRGRGVAVDVQRELYVAYRGERIRAGRIDLVVEACVLLELKSVERLLPVHISQVVAYLRASDLRLGLIINFNVQALKSGIRRVVL